jgi:hypothetical protein
MRGRLSSADTVENDLKEEGTPHNKELAVILEL